MLFLCKRPNLRCDFSPNATARDGNCLFHGKNLFKTFDVQIVAFIVAISDGILNNEAFRHTAGDIHNQTWTQLLLDFEFFEDVDNHTLDLRRKFVFGAADWMAGNNGSLQNDKLLFGYTDSQWEYIWSTMLEDGAWAVPSIKDGDGNVIKENFAPEILIKFIAHELRCNIIVFDLVLDSIQFISGNHIKSDNVVFNSPLLIYSTGSHFQSVFQEDHDFFINYSEELEAINAAAENNDKNTTEKCKASNLPTFEKAQEFDKTKLAASTSSNNTNKDNSSHQRSEEDEDKDMDFETIKNMKKKDRTAHQQRYFDKTRMKIQREKETPAKSESRKENNQENMKQQRKKETTAKSESRKENNRENMKQQWKKEATAKSESRKENNRENLKRKRKIETVAETALRKEQDKDHKKQKRELETEEQRADRCQQNKENMKRIRNNDSEIKRLKRFRESVRYGPIFTCTVCEQDMFFNSVNVLNKEFKESVKQKSSELFKMAFAKEHLIELDEKSNPYICGTCKTNLKQGKLPPMAASNGLDVVPIDDEDLHLTELENNLIAKRIMFQKIYQLPKSRMAACKDHLINIPIGSDDVLNTLQSLPRTPQEAGLLEVKLKRKLEYKNTHHQAYIDTQRVYKALDFLKINGHPEYQFFDDYHVYAKRCNRLELQNVNDDHVEPIIERDEFIKKYEYERNKEANVEVSDEDEDFVKNDVIRKFQFDYDISVCLVEKFPEAAEPEQITNENKQVSFAPGEGKIPENILSTKNWDRDAFPMKHPDGKNNIHHQRTRKLTEQYYFVQRLRNKDMRFSTDPAYTFAAAAYLEKKQLQSNINISYQRGNEIKSPEGISTFHLQDGFSVFDKISNTPKYWKTAKYEMLAKLDNLGPFQFFFTLSCADMRWDENLSSILRKLGRRIEYEVHSDGTETTWVKHGKDSKMELREYLETIVSTSLHEMIRRNVFIATQNYQHRVKAFITNIIEDKHNPMHVEYWSTKVEFQGRGAGHNHGTLWVDMNKMEFTFLDDEGKWSDLNRLLKISQNDISKIKVELKRLLNTHFVEEATLEDKDFLSLKNIFTQIFQTECDTEEFNLDENDVCNQLMIHFPFFGVAAAFKKFQTKEDLLDHEEKAIIAFVNKFTTCSLNAAVIASKTDDDDLKRMADKVIEIVRNVHIHRDTKSCRKYQTKCRYGFPRFPMWRTLITRPLEVSGEDGTALKNKYRKILKDVKDLLNEREVIENILADYPKELDITVEDYEHNRKKRILKLLSLAGLDSDEDVQLYEDALKYSTAGYSVVLERDLDEIFVNSYNPEWARAWNGNTDLQVCLDYFAVITYITEYYSKDDTGMMNKLLDMLKSSNCVTLKEKMKLVMNTFISARQMGECEAFYKVMPNFRLKDSNVTTIMIPTGKKETRSKFMIKVDDDFDYNGREKKKIAGKDGWYVEKYDLVDKYIRRDKACLEADEVSVVQFYKMYVATHKDSRKQTKDSTDSGNENEEAVIEDIIEVGTDIKGKFHYVMTASEGKPVPLPAYIKIENPFPGEPPLMRKRMKPAVIRFHKPKQDVDAAKYFFAEALLYTPFRSEKELEERVANAAKDGYKELEKWISRVKCQVMEHLESNEEARYMVEDANIKRQEMGELLDPEGEQEIEECNNETLFMHPEYEHLNPDELGLKENPGKIEKVYRMIEIDEMHVLREKTRSLDFYQRKVVEKGIQFSRKIVKSLKEKNCPPKSVNVIVHGGAGTGKSTVINILKQWCHIVLQQPGDDPECPYLIVAAPTGTAAANVRGQTMHSAFNFSWGNEHFSLSDKIRNLKRNLLKNLKLVIVDEISMVKSDQQFQLDRRLKEVTQKIEKLFGNVGIFYVGDIMQLKPCKGRYIFDEPINVDYKVDYHLGTHWQSFEVIILEENHRQGDDKDYADMLNRFRVGEQTEEDMQKLKDRVRPRNHPDLTGAMVVTCTNAEVEKHNRRMLNEIKEDLITLEAVNIHPTIKNFQPPIGKKGEVRDTPFLQTLQLKKRARVQLTYNIDTLDCLTNGARGEVVDVVKNAAGHVEHVMIKFDAIHQGKQKQEAQVKLTSMFPGCTSVERVMFQYSLAKKSQRVSNTAKVIQFPLSLCFAATSHRFQGQTIYKPLTLAADFRTVFEAAQSYVMLSRVETLSQLFIIDSLPENKFYASPKALTELERLQEVSINKKPPSWEQSHDWSLKILSLNCHSLADKIEDLRHDKTILMGDIICLTETWLRSDSLVDGLEIPGFDLHLNSIGIGRGISTYCKPSQGSLQANIKKQRVQITKMCTAELDVINIYRSQGADNSEMAKDLDQIIDQTKPTIICGDLNFCYITQRDNLVTTILEGKGFRQLIEEASHLQGGHIDHVYSNHDPDIFNVDILMYSPYYTSRDHDAFCITVMHTAQKLERQVLFTFN